MEFIKLKRYSVVKAGIIMTSLSALLSLFYSTADDGKTWTFEYFMRQVLINNCTLFFPIIITLIAGYIITREYTNDTIKKHFDDSFILSQTACRKIDDPFASYDFF